MTAPVVVADDVSKCFFLRHNRAGRAHLRFSPHFYNTESELDRVVEAIAAVRT